MRAALPLDDNHPVLMALEDELSELRMAYAMHPNEFTRYQLTRLETLIRQWAPAWQPGQAPAA